MLSLMSAARGRQVFDRNQNTEIIVMSSGDQANSEWVEFA